MTIGDKIEPPGPPDEQPVAFALHALVVAELAALKASTAASASQPQQLWMKLKACCHKAHVEYKTAYGYCANGEIDCYRIGADGIIIGIKDGKGPIMAEYYDLRDRWLRQGRHSGRKK